MSNVAKSLKALVLFTLLCPLTPMIVLTLIHNFVVPMSQDASQGWCFVLWFVQVGTLCVYAVRSLDSEK